ncbi:MAG: hypothetical protein KF866_11445 [Phycisphaeraceae bacterium]|nr:hypothetical protein [Phycisphaeraceae bacterium]
MGSLPSISRNTTRLAPSPTGALHLGNARTFLVNWAIARQRGWRIVLRIEDLDTPRVKPGAIDETISTLRALGIDWDEGPLVQSTDLRPYREAMRVLAARGDVHRCALTRGEIASAASAPQEGDHESRYDPSLRPTDAGKPVVFADEATNWRFLTSPGMVEFTDGFAGPQRIEVSGRLGDFVVWTKRGQPAYQLAVVVDDARQGITQIVRGNDLLDSAARQLLLYRSLGWEPEPAYTHLPLVRGEDGRRLAKRHGDTRVTEYLRRGVAVERMIALIGRWCGMEPEEHLSASAFASRLDLRRIPQHDIIFTSEDDRWLCTL